MEIVVGGMDSVAARWRRSVGPEVRARRRWVRAAACPCRPRDDGYRAPPPPSPPNGVLAWSSSPSTFSPSSSSSVSSSSSFLVLLLTIVVLLSQLRPIRSTPVVSDFDDDHRRVFQDASNFPAFFHTLYIDPTNASRMYIGAVDFIYQLNAENISTGHRRSANITDNAAYASRYDSSREFCKYLGTVTYPDLQCRNHIRAVFPVADNDSLYVCSTGSYSPQEFYVDTHSLDVIRVQEPLSGRAKCPYDPTSIYAFAYVVSGNPFNRPSLYTAVATDVASGYVGIIRPAILGNSAANFSILANLLRTDTDPKWINTAEAAYVVATFDVGPYVFFFFRELALESTAFCSKTYFSRVARICKNDEGGNGLNMEYRFTSFLKARLVCSVTSPPSSIPYYFDEVHDVYYNASAEMFYALFMANSNGHWGSAVCAYSLAAINNVFDSGAWVEQTKLESAWLRVHDNDVPVPRPGQCSSRSKDFVTSALSFIKSHPLMMDVIHPETGSPVFYSKNLAFNRLTVDYLTSYTVLFLYLPDNDELHRIVTATGTETRHRFYTASIWKPFSSLPSTGRTNLPLSVWSLTFHTIKQRKWLYITGDKAVIQMKPEQCSGYKYCTDCVRDPYCGWSVTNGCEVYTSGLLQSNSTSQSLALCSDSCTKTFVHTGVVAGMALHLNCSSHCRRPRADVTWTFQASVAGGSSTPVPLEGGPNFVLSHDGGLVILATQTTQHAGTFRCMFNETVLAKHDVSMSGCEFGENVRDVLTKEYVRWCKTFDEYNQQYKQWQCLKKKCIETNCIPDISSCK